jgi:hypothetical protein
VKPKEVKTTTKLHGYWSTPITEKANISSLSVRSHTRRKVLVRYSVYEVVLVLGKGVSLQTGGVINLAETSFHPENSSQAAS